MLFQLNVLMANHKRIIDLDGEGYWLVFSIATMELVMEKSAKDKHCMHT